MFAIATAQHGAVRFDVAVDPVGDELRYLTFFRAARLRVIGRDVEPPPAVEKTPSPRGLFPQTKAGPGFRSHLRAQTPHPPWLPIFFGNFSSRLAEVVAVFTHPYGPAFSANLGNH